MSCQLAVNSHPTQFLNPGVGSCLVVLACEQSRNFGDIQRKYSPSRAEFGTLGKRLVFVFDIRSTVTRKRVAFAI
jgi:hypothetical protein